MRAVKLNVPVLRHVMRFRFFFSTTKPRGFEFDLFLRTIPILDYCCSSIPGVVYNTTHTAHHLYMIPRAALPHYHSTKVDYD